MAVSAQRQTRRNLTYARNSNTVLSFCCLPADCPLLTPIVSKKIRASAKNKLGYAHLQVASKQVSRESQAQKAPQKAGIYSHCRTA
jgi:hypothetical protein